jgi:hypothetical protein
MMSSGNVNSNSGDFAREIFVVNIAVQLVFEVILRVDPMFRAAKRLHAAQRAWRGILCQTA